jgi:integrase
MSVSYNLNLRNAKSTKETPINLTIRWNGNRLVYPTGCSIIPKDWDLAKQLPTKKSKFIGKEKLETELSKLVTIAKTIGSDHIGKEDTLTIQNFRTKLNDQTGRELSSDVPKTFYAFLDNLIKIKETGYNVKSGKKFAAKTIYKYKELRTVLYDFEKNITFHDFTENKYIKFIEFLEEKNLAANTIGKYIKLLRAVLNDAKRKGIQFPDTYVNTYHSMTEESTSIYFDEDELSKLYSLDLSSRPSLDRVRDLFLIGCWTGLRFSDYVNFSKDKVDGDFIEVCAQKTDEIVVIPINETVRAILKKYDYCLPEPISNQKFNQHLKDLCQFAELDSTFVKKITRGGKKEIIEGKKYEFASSHTARRSFATNLYKQGFPTISIMAITGHKTEKSFLAYIKVTPREHAELLKKHWLAIKESKQENQTKTA